MPQPVTLRRPICEGEPASLCCNFFNYFICFAVAKFPSPVTGPGYIARLSSALGKNLPGSLLGRAVRFVPELVGMGWG